MKELSRAWHAMRLDYALSKNQTATMTTSMVALLSGKDMAENLPIVTRMLVDNQNIAGCNLVRTLINAHQKDQADAYTKMHTQFKAGANHITEDDVAKARQNIVESGQLHGKFQRDLLEISVNAVHQAERLTKEAQPKPRVQLAAAQSKFVQVHAPKQMPNTRILDMAASLKK